MSDIIWGNGKSIISNDSFTISVTHRKNGNKLDYSDHETIQIIDADLPGLPLDKNNWNVDSLRNSVIDAFLKCEIKERRSDGIIVAKVSHSGVGGY